MNERPVRLNRKQLRRIIEEAVSESPSHEIAETVDQITDAIAVQLGERFDDDQLHDAVTAAVLSELPDEQMARPVRYEDVEHYADQITDGVMAHLRDDVHWLASMVLRTLMEPE